MSQNLNKNLIGFCFIRLFVIDAQRFQTDDGSCLLGSSFAQLPSKLKNDVIRLKSLRLGIQFNSLLPTSMESCSKHCRLERRF